jgi:hypothetical protein
MSNEDPRFSDGGASVRKYQCFVCGVQFKEFDEYEAHIVSDHEEGREYLTCPDCQAPVRTMTDHYRAKHPNRIMPKGIQTRVTIWYDFNGKGDKKARKPKVREGDFQSHKMGKAIHYRSGYEADVYELLEQDRDVVAYHAEPFKVPYYFINRKGEGKWVNYIPDLKIQFADGRIEIWEIKPATQTGLEQNKAKWTAMNDYALKLGWDFTVITEVGINKLKDKVKSQQTTLAD